MKATAVESGNHHHSHGNVLGLNRSQDGKVHKAKHKEEENEEIKAYLLKLQELVPFMPKNRKLSKLEVIQYVIDYIRDLRQTLGMPPQSARLGLDSMIDPMEMMTSVVSSSLGTTTPTTNNNNIPTNNNTSSTNNNNNNNNNVILPSSHPSHHQRQPLGVISTPNNSSLHGSCAAQEVNSPIIIHS